MTETHLLDSWASGWCHVAATVQARVPVAPIPEAPRSRSPPLRGRTHPHPPPTLPHLHPSYLPPKAGICLCSAATLGCNLAMLRLGALRLRGLALRGSQGRPSSAGLREG